jgi:hypothetical protein
MIQGDTELMLDVPWPPLLREGRARDTARPQSVLCCRRGSDVESMSIAQWSDEDWLEAGVPDEASRGHERLGVIARHRDRDLVPGTNGPLTEVSCSRSY